MKISINKSGGFAGFDHEPVASVSTEELEESLAEEVAQMLTTLGFTDLPEFIAGEEFGADFFRYEIMLKDGDTEHRLEFIDDDTSQTTPLKEFVQRIKSIESMADASGPVLREFD